MLFEPEINHYQLSWDKAKAPMKYVKLVASSVLFFSYRKETERFYKFKQLYNLIKIHEI